MSDDNAVKVTTVEGTLEMPKINLTIAFKKTPTAKVSNLKHDLHTVLEIIAENVEQTDLHNFHNDGSAEVLKMVSAAIKGAHIELKELEKRRLN